MAKRSLSQHVTLTIKKLIYCSAVKTKRKKMVDSINRKKVFDKTQQLLTM